MFLKDWDVVRWNDESTDIKRFDNFIDGITQVEVRVSIQWHVDVDVSNFEQKFWKRVHLKFPRSLAWRASRNEKKQLWKKMGWHTLK